LFWVRKQRISNPEAKKLKEFVFWFDVKKNRTKNIFEGRYAISSVIFQLDGRQNLESENPVDYGIIRIQLIRPSDQLSLQCNLFHIPFNSFIFPIRPLFPSINPSYEIDLNTD
jgi:hypothetical protein